MEDPGKDISNLRDLVYVLLARRVPVIKATARVAAERFNQLADKEFQSFLANPEITTADVFSHIEKTRQQVKEAMRKVWAGMEDWFEEECGPAPDGVDAALVRLANAAVLRTRQVSNLRGSAPLCSETGERTIGGLRSSPRSSPINEGDKFAELGGAETGEARSRTSEASTMSDQTPSAPHGKRGFPADDEGHLRVAELLPSDWQKDLPGALKMLANPPDGGPSVKLSDAWQKKYEIKSYADVANRIGDKEIIQHLERRRKLGIDLRTPEKSRKVSDNPKDSPQPTEILSHPST